MFNIFEHIDASDYKETSGGEVRYCCPFCEQRHPGKTPDTDYHLYYNSDKGVYFCFRCGLRGRSNNETPELVSTGKTFDDILADMERSFVSGRNYSTFGEVKSIKSAVAITEGLLAYDYLISRNVNKKQIAFYKMYLSEYDCFSRIHIPGFDVSGKLVCSIGRSYLENSKYRYINSDFKKSEYIWNLDKAIKNDYIVVCEGPFSAIASGTSGVATLGKFVSPSQVAILRDYAYNKKLYVCLDRDARKESLKLWSKLGCLGLDSYFVDWDKLEQGKDPSEVSKNDFENLLDRAEKYNFSSYVKAYL